MIMSNFGFHFISYGRKRLVVEIGMKNFLLCKLAVSQNCFHNPSLFVLAGSLAVAVSPDASFLNRDKQNLLFPCFD